MTLDSLALVTYPALLLVLAYFVKRWMDDLKTTVERYGEQQRTCQLSLATTYRTKTDAEKSWAAHLLTEAVQDVKLNDLTSRVVKLEAQCSTRHGD